MFSHVPAHVHDRVCCNQCDSVTVMSFVSWFPITFSLPLLALPLPSLPSPLPAPPLPSPPCSTPPLTTAPAGHGEAYVGVQGYEEASWKRGGQVECTTPQTPLQTTTYVRMLQVYTVKS